MTQPETDIPDRPETALELKDVSIGDRIVSYSPNGTEKEEIEIISIDDAVEHEEEVVLVTYRPIRTHRTYTRLASDLGLTPRSDSTWHRYAIPFDENI